MLKKLGITLIVIGMIWAIGGYFVGGSYDTYLGQRLTFKQLLTTSDLHMWVGGVTALIGLVSVIVGTNVKNKTSD